MENGRIELSFIGINEDWSNLGDFTINSESFYKMRFISANRVIFFLKNKCMPKTIDEYIEECREFLISFYVHMVNDRTFHLSDNFVIDETNTNTILPDKALIKTSETIEAFDCAEVVCQKDNNGRIKTSDEIESEQIILKQQKIQNAIFASETNSAYT